MCHFRWLPLLAVLCLTPVLLAHDSFLPHHYHAGPHDHAEHEHGHDERELAAHGKHSAAPPSPGWLEERFALVGGARFKRYSPESGRAHLWETGVGVDVALVPWLHVGGDVSYGWFESDDGAADGWLTPHAHLDLHLPLHGALELVAGLEVGFPGGEKTLVGQHWEWAPHFELRYDPGHWFLDGGASLAFLVGQDDHPSHDHDHGAGEHAEEHAHDLDFHEIVDPHGERELRYFAAAGIRLLERRLSLQSRLSGVHVLAGETPSDNYLRAGLRASFILHERLMVTTDGSVPITAAERNQWETSAGFRIAF